MPLDMPSPDKPPVSAGYLNFMQLFDTMPTPYMVMDRQLHVIYANKAYLTMLERSLDQISGRYIFDAFPDTPERVASVREIFLRTLDGVTTQLESQDFRFEHPDGTTSTRCWQCTQTPYFDGTGKVVYIVQHAEDVTDEAKLQRQNEAISLELDHRVKNVFSIVQAVAAMAGRNAGSIAAFREDFEDRIMAMSRTHGLLARTNWAGLSLKDILEASVEQYGGFQPGRVSFHGPDVTLSPRASQMASLLGHELATNAAKYGCFSRRGGRLDVTFRPDPSRMTLEVEWKESGLSGIRPPEQCGFGTQLETFMNNVSIDRDYEDDGIRVTIEAFLPDSPWDRFAADQVPGARA